MKNIRFTLVAAAMILLGVYAKAQTADEIIQKHISAIGGNDNWKKVSSLKLNASINGGGVEIPVTITTLDGKGQRVEFTVGGLTGYQIITPTAGWNYNPMAGQTSPEAMTDNEVKESQSELNVSGDLVDYKTKGNTVSLIGKDDVEGTECYKLKVVCKGGKEKTIFIDASNYYMIRELEKAKADGKEVELKTSFGNFQKLPEGIVIPMAIDNEDGSIVVKTAEVNKTIDEGLFRPTEVKK